jgi:hypothetical protein
VEYIAAIWFILWPFGNFVAIWYIWVYGIFYPILVYCVNKNLAPLLMIRDVGLNRAGGEGKVPSLGFRK